MNRLFRVFDVRVKNFTVSRAVASIVFAVLGGTAGAAVAKLLCSEAGIELLAYAAGAFVGLRAQAWWLNRSDARRTSVAGE